MAETGTIPIIPGYTTLTPKQIQAVQLRFAEKPYKEIANMLCVHVQTIKQWFSRGKLDGALKSYTELQLSPMQAQVMDVQAKIKDHAHRAVDRMGQLIDANSEDVRFRACKDILDRAGYAPIDRHATLHAIEEMDASQLRDAFDRIMHEYDPSVKSTNNTEASKQANSEPYIEEGD